MSFSSPDESDETVLHLLFESNWEDVSLAILGGLRRSTAVQPRLVGFTPDFFPKGEWNSFSNLSISS